MSGEDRYPSYRAPQTNRDVLCIPDRDAVLRSAPTAREAINSTEVKILGVPLPELASEARRSLLAEAKCYTHSYIDSQSEIDESGPLIITGHQPELIHPGVWLKNFAAAKFAKAVSGTAINLIIDSDLCRKPSIRVPTGTIDQPQSIDIAFDDPQAEMPYESRAINNLECWSSFSQRVHSAIKPLVPDAMITNWWPREPSDQNLGLAVAQARHRQELDWGSDTLELPQSRVCQLTAFRRFALQLLVDAERVQGEYNRALADYRHAHRLRSAAQPLPDLQVEDGWLETPFWIWSETNPARRALFVRETPAGLALTDRHDWQATIPNPRDANAEDCLQSLGDLEETGIKIRTRALITTLFARLMLADTFIHGIGGAKYDQVTEHLCERLFGIRLPQMVVLSGTLRLPIDHEQVSDGRLSQLKQTLRELRYHPETHLVGLELSAAERQQVETQIASKRDWVQTAKTPNNAAERHAQIESANLALQAWVDPQRRKIEMELSRIASQIRVNQLLESREYPFCLFPPELLMGFLLDF